MSSTSKRALRNSAFLERQARKKTWNEEIRYCTECFYLIKDEGSTTTHSSYEECLQARDEKLPLNPRMFKILKERKSSTPANAGG